MSATGLGRQLRRLAHRLVPPDDPMIGILARWVAERDARRAAILAHVPADLRRRVEMALAEPDGLDGWADAPFARWATMPKGFVFPRRLVEWLLAPPRDWFLGHACEVCGLNVPLLLTWANDPDPPASIVVFPACPACGGRTCYAANSGPGGA